MKTNQSIKANLAIIILTIAVVFWHPTIVKAETLKSLKLSLLNESNFTESKLSKVNETEKAPLNLNELEIEPINEQLHANVSSLKIEIDIEELKQINHARKKALELEKQKQEEARKKALEEQRAKEKAEADAKAKEITANSKAISYDELVAKLNRSLNSTLAGKGESFAKYATELGINPYLAVAIVLHETGCKWNCSTLLKQCNNVGGMKGTPGCNGGSYKAFPSLDEGIKAFMNNLYKNYYAKGLTTPETIGPKYAASKTWASKIHIYMKEIETK